jgi:hypothetical protein
MQLTMGMHHSRRAHFMMKGIGLPSANPSLQ